MKKLSLGYVFAGLALVATSQTAGAASDEWTPTFHIDNLIAYGDGVRVDGVPVTPPSGFNVNPAGCSTPLSTQVFALPTLSAAAKEEMSRILTSALLADRGVRLRLEGENATVGCDGANRYYIAVRMY